MDLDILCRCMVAMVDGYDDGRDDGRDLFDKE